MSRLFLTVLLFMFCSLLRAQDIPSQLFWTTYTSSGRITSIEGDHSKLWAGTEGGLILYYFEDNKVEKLVNTDGLASNMITCTAVAEDGSGWIGFQSGSLQYYQPDEKKWLSIRDYEGYSISSLKLHGDTLWVGLDIGLSLFLISKREVRETYRNLGYEFSRDEAVNNILITPTHIWAGTASGAAYASLTESNLLDPANWNNIINDLPDPDVTALAAYDSAVYIGTSAGLARWDSGNVSFISDDSVLDLSYMNDGVAVLAKHALKVFSNGTMTDLSLPPDSPFIMHASNDYIWTGGEKGLSFFSIDNQTWAQLELESLPDNIIWQTVFDSKKRLWAGTARGGFSVRLNEDTWQTFSPSTVTGMISNDVRTLLLDDENIWAGSWGGGIVHVDTLGNISFFNAGNNMLSGIPGSAHYAVVPDMIKDSAGTIWILNYLAANQRPLIAVDTENDWIYYHLADGIMSTRLTVLCEDAYGRKWIGSDDNGVIVLDDKSAPHQKADVDIMHFRSSDGLLSNNVTALAADESGMVWIGTAQGLNASYGNMIEEYEKRLIGTFITALLLDPAGNLWIGTNNGLILYLRNVNEPIVFNTGNSYLPDDFITSLMMDKETGSLYISTNNGLSHVQTPFYKTKAGNVPLTVYPNPFIPQNHQHMLVDGISLESNVYIYTSSGQLVRSVENKDIFGRTWQWDGMNNSGESVASGIYLILAADMDGSIQKGKVTLIR